MKAVFQSLVILELIIIASLPTLAAPGDLDVNFGNGGVVVTSVGSANSIAQGMAIQGDKIVVAGYAVIGGSEDFCLVRYNFDGTLDTTFGSAHNGVVTTPIGFLNDRAYGVAIQSDGKIVVAGSANRAPNNYASFALARFNADGSLDTSFGGGTGKVMTQIGSFGAIGYSIALQNDNKIVVAGYSWQGNNYDFTIVRYTNTGILDNQFNNTGIVTSPVGSSYDVARCVALGGNNRILAAGWFTAANYDIAVLGFSNSGSLDGSFGNNGIVKTSIGISDDGAYGIANQDGKIVVAGFTKTGADSNSPINIALARYSDLGAIDSTFGSNGKVTTSIGNVDDQAFSLGIQKDSKIVIAGRSKNGNYFDFAVARYLNNGALDSTFGNGGKVTTAVGSDNREALCLALQDDHKIVVAGYTTEIISLNPKQTKQSIALARYLSDSPPSIQTVAALNITSTSALLNGLVNANGSPTTLTFEYGPSASYGTIIAASPATADGGTGITTSATISNLAPGTLYHFRVNGTSSAGTMSGGDLTFTTLTNFQAWRQGYFGTTDNSGNAADTADADHDGLPNLLEFAINSTPLAFSAPPGTLVLNGENLEFNYTRSKEAISDGFVFTVEWCDDLKTGNWTNTGVMETILSDNGNIQQVRAVFPAGGSNHRFAHIKVLEP